MVDQSESFTSSDYFSNDVQTDDSGKRLLEVNWSKAVLKNRDASSESPKPLLEVDSSKRLLKSLIRLVKMPNGCWMPIRANDFPILVQLQRLDDSNKQFSY